MNREVKKARKAFKQITGLDPTYDQLTYFMDQGNSPFIWWRRAGRTTAALATAVDQAINGGDVTIIVRDGASQQTLHELSHLLDRAKKRRNLTGMRVIKYPPKYFRNSVRVGVRGKGTSVINVQTVSQASNVRPQVAADHLMILDHS